MCFNSTEASLAAGPVVPLRGDFGCEILLIIQKFKNTQEVTHENYQYSHHSEITACGVDTETLWVFIYIHACLFYTSNAH